MEIRQLRCVVTAAEDLHFTQAARRLGMSKAAFSVAIKQAEQDVGHVLFDRTSRSVRLTPAGAELYRRGAAVLEQFDRATTNLDRVAAGQAGTLRVGIDTSAASSILPAAVSRVRQEAPDLVVVLEPVAGGEALDRLLDQSLDVALVRGKAHASETTLAPVWTEPLVACVPAGHELAHAVTVSPEELAGQPLIAAMSSLAPGYAAEVRAVFEGGPLPRVRARTHSFEETLALVAIAEGVALAPASVAGHTPDAVRVLVISTKPQTTLYLASNGAITRGGTLLKDALLDAGTS